MVSNKLMATAFAVLASIAVVDAGVCMPHGTSAISSASATETSNMTIATSTSVTIEIDKSLHKAGSYALEGFVKVNSSGNEGEGCTRAVAACLIGPIGETEAILDVGVLPAIAAEGRWAKISTVCEVMEEKLGEIDDFGVAVGFECFNTDAYLDSVSFKAVEVGIE